MEGQTEDLDSQGITSPLGNKVHPWGQSPFLGLKIKTGLSVFTKAVDASVVRTTASLHLTTGSKPGLPDFQ
jgi:hypothetical protein